MVIDIELFRSRLRDQKYSAKSIYSYLTCMQQFLSGFKNCEAEAITIELIERHVLWLVEEKGISKSYQKQILASIRKYYDLVLNRKIDLSAIYPKDQSSHLPSCLFKSDVKVMIEKTKNLKHKVIICLLYSGGLRLTDLLNLALQDIDPVKNEIHIIEEKAKKERIVMLSPFLSNLLPEYYKKYKPRHFVLEGPGGKAYSEKSVQQVVRLAGQRAGITAQVTPHCLRHSFAVHLLDSGTDIHYVQELLGHMSIKTTENYTHNSYISNSNIKSPLDLL